MIKDFMYGFGGYGKGYDTYDLKKGIIYAEELLGQGYKKEPFWEYNLKVFINWCKTKLRGETHAETDKKPIQ